MNAQTKIAPGTFAEAFVALQADIKPAVKDAKNEAFKRDGKASKYADLGAVWEAVKEPLKTHGFAIIQMPQFEGETMYLETILLHSSGEKMAGRYPLVPIKKDPQGYGSAITYARRYAMCAMLGVIADDDDDGNAASGVGTRQTPPPRQPDPEPKKKPVRYDDDDGQTANWVARQKELIASCKTLPATYTWLENVAGRGSISDPDAGGTLDRLKTKSPELYGELVQAFQKQLVEINRSAAA